MRTEYRHDSAHVGLREIVSRVLSAHPDISHLDLCCEVVPDELVLIGRVDSYYRKQLAQESLRSLAGHRRIRNELEVVPA